MVKIEIGRYAFSAFPYVIVCNAGQFRAALQLRSVSQ